jgi:transcriptional regulator with XRE-family HTH domain
MMIGPVVRQLRQQRKLSQEALANTAHVSSGYLSKLERGVYKAPSIEVLSRIASALSVAPAELYRAAGLEELFHQQDPNLSSAIESYAPSLSDLPKRDRDIIMNELRRIFREEAPDEL